jgi:outer membrane immunogenic protein
MKALLLTATLIAAGAAAGPAGAADLPARPAVVPVYVPPAYSWTGCFFGAAAGATFGQSQHVAAGPANLGAPITDSFNVVGALLGGSVGCNYQVSHLVIGVANDFFWTNAAGSSGDLAPFLAGTTSSTKEHWLDALRGRAGLAFDRLFIYGTGGVAWAGVQAGVCTPADLCDSQTRRRVGWVAGGGAEVAAWSGPSGSTTLRIEYLHVDLGSATYFSPPEPIGAGTIVSRNVRMTNDMVTAGINWKFNLVSGY